MKIKNVDEDVEILAENIEGILDEMREVFCENDGEVERLSCYSRTSATQS